MNNNSINSNDLNSSSSNTSSEYQQQQQQLQQQQQSPFRYINNSNSISSNNLYNKSIFSNSNNNNSNGNNNNGSNSIYNNNNNINNNNNNNNSINDHLHDMKRSKSTPFLNLQQMQYIQQQQQQQLMQSSSSSSLLSPNSSSLNTNYPYTTSSLYKSNLYNSTNTTNNNNDRYNNNNDIVNRLENQIQQILNEVEELKKKIKIMEEQQGNTNNWGLKYSRRVLITSNFLLETSITSCDGTVFECHGGTQSYFVATAGGDLQCSEKESIIPNFIMNCLYIFRGAGNVLPQFSDSSIWMYGKEYKPPDPNDQKSNIDSSISSDSSNVSADGHRQQQQQHQQINDGVSKLVIRDEEDSINHSSSIMSGSFELTNIIDSSSTGNNNTTTTTTTTTNNNSNNNNNNNNNRQPSFINEFLEDFSNKIWMSYRQGFPYIGDTMFENDCGWGYWKKSGQNEYPELLYNIVRMFLDKPTAPFSIHNIALHGQNHLGKNVGEWFAPSNITHAIKSLVNKFNLQCNISVVISEDGSLYVDQMLDAALQPNGSIVGGKPRASLYFIAAQDDNLFYLDPHTVQQAIDNEVEFSLSVSVETKEDFLDFLERSKKLVSKSEFPLYNIAERVPDYQLQKTMSVEGEEEDSSDDIDFEMEYHML
ncbi:hypothetical protein PPL_04309 [Heterostelium album PN500]|uniref:Cysteine protease n=1 Tax=Heterostelium pallidum (strain ATCC 26659 / Pp 5 / PN500) TaxID=670386 RepID=D3B774_HETP5|nr:hypothetical protein PPL_04309 [Heterostelium album PN500]EFA82617.1 hypothetical protein PPL_04309 [Heterostelium album PN500]|eukprot:XP_020434734.1 hypothetical protein PPL_04309 [Heterostelium album PN500]